MSRAAGRLGWRDRYGLAAAIVLVATACGGAQGRPGTARAPSPIELLRKEAAAKPTDAAIMGRLAEAELLWDGGDSAQLRPAIDRAVSLNDSDPLLRFISGLAYEQRGLTEQALPEYLRAIELARVSDDPLAPAIAEVVIDRLPDPGYVNGYDQQVYPLLQKVFDQPGRLGLPARDSAAQSLIGKAFRDGEPKRAEQLARAHGCPQSWRGAGPFGPYTWLGFDGGVAAEGKGELAKEYDLGPGRGKKPTWEAGVDGCDIRLSDAPQLGAGVIVLETQLDVKESGKHLLMMRLPTTARVRLDGELVGVVDRRDQWRPAYSYWPLELEAGKHELEVTLAAAGPTDRMSVALERVGAVAGYEPSRGVAAPQGDGAAQVFLRALVLEGRQDPVSALEAIDALDGRMPTATTLMHRVSILSDHPFVPREQKEELYRRTFMRAAERDPHAYLPALLVARTEQGDRESFEGLKSAAERFADVTEVQLQYAAELEEKGQHSEALAIAERLRKKLPESCAVLETYERILRGGQRIQQANALTDESLRCDRRSTDRFALRMRQERWDEAKEELERLTPLISKAHGRSLREALARAVGDDALVRELEDEGQKKESAVASIALIEADRMLSAGKATQASRALEKAMASNPRATHGLRRVYRALTGKGDLEPYRIDGLKAIANFNASKRDYGGFGRVLVLDYMAIRVFEDGSSLSLIHQIFKVQSEEALEELGQLSLGGQLLTVRSIKSDGRLLEPEAIEGLDSIPVTDLAVGDFVEYEYVVPRAASPTGGFDSGGWVFQSYDEPFDLSQITIILPKTMELVVNAEGPVPEPVVKARGALRQLTWTMERSLPLRREPDSVPHPPFIPSLRVGVGMTWAAHIDAIREHDAARDPVDPHAKRILGDILSSKEELSRDAKIDRIHAWVRANIDPAGGGDAPTMIRARRGNPFAVYRYLLRLAGIDTKLVFVREHGGPEPTELATSDVYSSVVLMTNGPSPRFLWFGSRFAPSGFIPSGLRGQEGIVVQEGTPKVRVPKGSLDQDRMEVDVNVNVDARGNGVIEVAETHYGARAVVWRTQLESVPAADLERVFEQQYVPGVLPGATMLGIAIEGREEVGGPLVLRYSAEVESIGRPAGSDRMLTPFFPTPLHRMYADLPSRETTRLIEANNTRVRVRLQGSGSPKRPSDEKIEGPQGAVYSRTSRIDNGALLVERTVSVPSMLVPVALYPELVRFSHRAAVIEAEELAITQP